MDINLSHNHFKESFGVEPGRLLQTLSEQKALLIGEFSRLNKLGIIDDETWNDVIKKGSSITFKYFPEYFEGLKDELQNTDS